MRRDCPFNTEGYVSGLVGEPQYGIRSGLVILRRPIPGTTRHDGRGPWPYLWIDQPKEQRALCEEFPDLVTVTAVTQPGYAPDPSWGNPTLLKTHFVYDPRQPAVTLSRRARLRLSRSEARGEFRPVLSMADRLKMADIHARLLARRGLTGSFVDFPRAHFEQIARLEHAVFFEVRDAQAIGAMACGVIFRDMLQILHMGSTDEGLRWNASYLLMAGLQRCARELDLRLLTGGMPDSGTNGLRVFKERWANQAEPVYLLRIVNDPEAYAALCDNGACEGSYFPAYRSRSVLGG